MNHKKLASTQLYELQIVNSKLNDNSTMNNQMLQEPKVMFEPFTLLIQKVIKFTLNKVKRFSYSTIGLVMNYQRSNNVN